MITDINISLTLCAPSYNHRKSICICVCLFPPGRVLELSVAARCFKEIDELSWPTIFSHFWRRTRRRGRSWWEGWRGRRRQGWGGWERGRWWRRGKWEKWENQNFGAFWVADNCHLLPDVDPPPNKVLGKQASSTEGKTEVPPAFMSSNAFSS